MKTALYAGTFDPPTVGHINIIERAAPLFTLLIIGVADNSEKKGFLSKKERVERLKKALRKLSNVKVVSYSGLTWQFAKKQKVDLLLRSLRVGDDNSMEFSLAAANREYSGLETLFLPADPALSFVSSSLVREILSAGGNADRYLA